MFAPTRVATANAWRLASLRACGSKMTVKLRVTSFTESIDASQSARTIASRPLRDAKHSVPRVVGAHGPSVSSIRSGKAFSVAMTPSTSPSDRLRRDSRFESRDRGAREAIAQPVRPGVARSRRGRPWRALLRTAQPSSKSCRASGQDARVGRPSTTLYASVFSLAEWRDRSRRGRERGRRDRDQHLGASSLACRVARSS